MSQASVRTAARRVGVLGPVVVESPSGAAVEPGGATAKALIVALLLARGALSVHAIVDDLWQDEPPRNQKAALQTLVSRVRSIAGPALIVSTPGGYALGIDAVQSDLGAAALHRDAARAACDRAEWQEAQAQASAGLELWRGQPGVDLGDTELAERLAASAAALHGELALLRAHARVELGDAQGALDDLAGLSEAAPFDERVELLKLEAIAASGRPNDAIREFAAFKQRLGDQLGTDPSAALVAFNAELLKAPQLPAEPSRTLRAGIRTAPNELVGRDDDIAAVEQLMGSGRLITILGPGGMGKTRLAQALAARAAERIPGVVVVELASVRTGDDVPLALASTLGIREYTGTRLSLSDPAVRVDVRARILSTLGERQTLLVVDNCEHLIDAAAEWIADILASTRSVRVLATSRAPLMIAAEQVYQLEPLPATAEGRLGDGTQERQAGPAVTLFMERARAARPSVVLPVEVIERLCERLDGLPLAIELAAARVRTMSVEEIERRISNRFALLRGGDRSAPERHRTLLAVIDWSWNLLSRSEQHTLRRLSPFVDGFSAAAAIAVGGSEDVEAGLEGLVNQSLVSAVDSTLTGQVRYRMLETVREFGGQQLAEAGESDLAAASIREWADSFSLAALRTTYGPDQIATFRQVEQEQDNLVSALRDAIAVGDAATVCAIYAALGMHWTLRGAHSEVLGLAQPVLEVLRRYDADTEHHDAAMVSLALIGATSLVNDARQGMRSILRVRKMHARQTATDPQLEAMLSLLLVMPDMGKAVRVIERLRMSGDPTVSAFALLISSQLAENAGRLDDGIADSSQAYASAELGKDLWTRGMAAHNLAQLHSERGDHAEVLDWAGRARTSLELLHAGEDLMQLEWLVAINRLALGELDASRAAFRQLADMQGGDDSFDWRDLKAIGFAGLAEVAAAEGDVAESLRLYCEAEQVWGDPPRGFAPWYYGAAAGVLAASARAGDPELPRARAVAKRVRIRMLRDARVRAGMIDRPITGVAAVGLGVWLLALGRDGAHDGKPGSEQRSGLELLLLARGIRARRDFPSLDPERAIEDARREHPGLDADASWTRIEAMTLEERTTRLNDVVRSLRPLFT